MRKNENHTVISNLEMNQDGMVTVWFYLSWVKKKLLFLAL